MTLTVEGGAALRKALRAAEGNLTSMSAVHRETADIVAAEAIRSAPVLTGALRSTVRAAPTTTAARVRAGGRTKGTFPRLSRPDKRTGKRRKLPGALDYVKYAQITESRKPWLRPAIQRTRNEWEGTFRKGVADIIRKVSHG
jgi:hypothetical protein